MKTKMFLIVSLTFAAISGVLKAAQFDEIFVWVERMQMGERIDLSVRATDEEVTFFRDEVKATDAAAAREQMERSIALPTLRFDEENDVLVYPLPGDVRIEQRMSRGVDHNTSWFKSEPVSVAKFSRKDWPAFLKECVKRGLLEITQLTAGPTSALHIGFKPEQPAKFESGGRTLRLTPEFSSYMKASPRDKPAAGDMGLVVLVHEPHANVNGQFQMVPGIKALADGNPDTKFRFLVEGEFDPDKRDIGFNTLDQKLDATRRQSSGAPFVYRLLANHVIDGPTAYRLLYDRDSPAFAIDDLRFLRSTTYGEEPASRAKIDESLRNVLLAVRPKEGETPDPMIRKVMSAIIQARAYVASEGSAPGQVLIDYFKTVSSLLNVTGELAEALSSTGDNLKEDAAFLKQQSKAYNGQAGIFSDALQRNAKMADFIIKFAKANDRRIPVAFIGSYHTEGITELLRAAKIGYIVIEERFAAPTTPEEQVHFNRMLFKESRDAALQTLLQSRKMKVTLSEEEVNTFVSPTFEKQFDRITAESARARGEFAKLSTKNLRYDTFRDAMNANGSLANARLGFGFGGGEPPPPVFRGAFASFDDGGGGGGGPRFFIHDAGEASWKGPSRYKFVARAVLPFPEFLKGVDFKKLRFSQDLETKRLFVSCYDSSTRRYYLFEGERAMNLLLQVEPPASKDDEILTRLHLAEYLKKAIKIGNGARVEYIKRT